MEASVSVPRSFRTGPKFCPLCELSSVINQIEHLIRSHNLSGKEKKTLSRKAHFMTMSNKGREQPRPSIPRLATTKSMDSLVTLFLTSSLPEQNEPPNRVRVKFTSIENE